MAIAKENLQLKQEKMILQLDLNGREQQLRDLEQKLSSTEKLVESLQQHNEEYRKHVESVSREVAEKDQIFVEQTREVERIKTKMQKKLASERDRLRRIMERKLSAKQSELDRRMCLFNKKFRQLSEILNADERDYLGDYNVPSPRIPSIASSKSSVPMNRCKILADTEPTAKTEFTKTRSASEFVHSKNEENVQLSGQSSRNAMDPQESSMYSPRMFFRNIGLLTRRARDSLVVRWKALQKASKVKDTVLKPSIKKKKSVSNLEVKDVTTCEKCVLQLEEQYSQGEVKTQLYMADIIPPAGGGAQVIFVKNLRQVSPHTVYNLRKRSGDNLSLRDVKDREEEIIP